MAKRAAAVYFPGLNALRFFAAMAVAASHVELLKQYNGLPNAYDEPAVYELGRLAVTLFFVLSGYLITYLLLTEKKAAGAISVRDFYVRRILRIWPLYYLLVLLAFFVFPRIGPLTIPKLAVTQHTLPLFLLLLPQLALSVADPVPFAEPAWSIGVEEQFYLIWPLLIRRTRRFVPMALAVIAISFALRYGAFGMALASRANPQRLAFWNQAISYFYFTRIECMAIGGLAAWLVFEQRRKMLHFLYRRDVQLAVYVATAWLVVTPRFKPIFNYAGYSILFAVLILNVSTNPRSLLKLNSRPFTFLGNISFSIYMFHEVAIQLVLQTPLRASNGALYAASLSLTLVIAAASYLLFERAFLRWKSRFAIVPSTPAPLSV